MRSSMDYQEEVERIRNKTYGYIRVSGTDQNEDRQLIAMKEKASPEDFPKIVSNWEKNRISLAEVLEVCGFSEATFYRRVRELRLGRG